MKIFGLKEYDLKHQAEDRIDRKFSLVPTPAGRAMQLLLAALDTVNQAGLDGKKLTDITIVEKHSPERGEDVIEIHAKVVHRLAQDSGRPT